MHRGQSRQVNRRSLLLRAADLARGAAASRAFAPAVAALGLSGSISAAPGASESLAPPPEIRSRNGVLETTITAAAGPVRMGDVSFPGFLYNEAYVPPVLRVRVGDTMLIALHNNLPAAPTNLHFHGLSVSPQGHGDNVFVHVHAGETFQYRVHIPASGRQGPGLFWYHPHAHGFVNTQILLGLSGGLVVDGSERLFPILEGMRERLLLIKQAKIGHDDLVSINGQINPAIEISPGEMQFWRIAHIGASIFLKFRIEGMPLYLVATDGHPLPRPRKVTEFFIGPGERIEAIAIGPQAGEYPMRTVSFQNEAWRPPELVRDLALIVSAGAGRPGKDSASDVLRQRRDGPLWAEEVRAAPIARRRTLVYSRTLDRQIFMIDGRVMSEKRIDQTATLGDTEEWTVVNEDQQYHSFHIHQTPFLVTEVGGMPADQDSLKDTASVPPATERGPGTLKVVIPFTDPVIVGRFVYHCHAVDHEDKGMMGVIEVVEP